MTDATYFHINAPGVIGEIIQDEAILVNLDNGSYYSLGASGSAAWGLVEQGLSLEDAAARLAARYDASQAEILAALQALFQEMLVEGLVVAGRREAAEGIASGDEPVPAERRPFPQPALEKYTDMADLLLLDPIHEVDEDGWPHARPA